MVKTSTTSPARVRGALTLAGLVLSLLAGTPARGAWFDTAWPCRRAVDVEIDPAKATGDEVAVADFYTAGHHVASGENIRVTSDEGKLVPSRVLMVGPGDRLRVAFAAKAGSRRYYIYFGHPKAPPAPKGSDEVPWRCGLMLEMRKLQGPVENGRQLEDSFERAKTVIGRTLIPQLYLGVNPFGEEAQTVSKVTGIFFAAIDGEYAFAASADDKGLLIIDGKPLVFAPFPAGDVRFNAKVQLKKGHHDIAFIHANLAGDGRFSVVWKRPDGQGFELMHRDAFGIIPRVTEGALEANSKAVVADFSVAYAGETFFSEHYTHRYKFAAATSSKLPAGGPAPRYEWDFGDGQSGTGASVEHVFLTEGEHAVKLTVKTGAVTSSETNRVVVSRLYERLDDPPGDVPSAHAKIVAGYDVTKMSPRQLVWATLLHHRTKQVDAIEKTAGQLARTTDGVDSGVLLAALDLACDLLADTARADSAARIWASVPAKSPVAVRAARREAEVLLYRLGDFDKAVKVLEPFARDERVDAPLKRTYAQALVLAQKPEAGAKILESLPLGGPAERQAAICGALARSIEFYITENDPDTGEATWDKWQQQYPADFLEGYGVLLKSRLIESAKYPQAAAKVAEAFALAMPKSSYAPRLLDRAARLLEKSDAPKAASIRALLKQKYPEDALSQ